MTADSALLLAARVSLAALSLSFLAAFTPCIAQTATQDGPTAPASTAAPGATAPGSSDSRAQSTSATGARSTGPSADPAATTAAGAQPPRAESTPSAAASNVSTEPSPEFVKQARKEGFRPKKQRNGETLYCYSDASLGTHFVTEKCFNQAQLVEEIQRRKDQRDVLGHPGACTGASCSGH